MRYRGLIKPVTLIVTLCIGVTLAGFHWRHKVSAALGMFNEPMPESKPDNSPITFSCDGIRSGFRTHYRSSDGQFLNYGCYEHSSPAVAEHELQEEVRMAYHQSPEGQLTKVGIVERTVTYDGNGNKIGERVVLDNGEILWTVDSCIHEISARSVQYALLFEKSRVWAWEDCLNVTALEKPSDGRTPPNNSLNRSAN